MSNIRFKGTVVVNSELHPFQPSHFNFLQGWLTKYAEEYPSHRAFTVIVTPINQFTLELEIYDPGTAVAVHLEQSIQPFTVSPGITMSLEDIPEDEDVLGGRRGFMDIEEGVA